MSTWNIYHKDGSKLTDVNGEQITVHGLEYSDSWMGECFVTINFKHEVPINFQIGDYIVYRGERFELNYEPGKDKQARPDTYGKGFVYDSVKFNALQDELSRAEFLDVVLNDNELHYTTLPKFPFYVQTLDDLLDRIQANLDDQIGAGLWKIYSRNMERSVQRGCLASDWLSMYGEGTNDNVIESMSITVDSQTCWQALALVNEKWDINFIVRGRNIYVGTTGIQENHIFKYGLGNGLYEIVQNADSDQSVVTRLRVYGSEKNLPSHYYADLGVKYVSNITKVVGASTNVELELDLDYIETYFKNPRKYIVPGETGEQSFGWVLQVTFDFQTIITGYVTHAYDSKKCRFYSELKGTQTDTGDEVSKEKLDAFIAQVNAGNTKMYITSGLNKKNVPSSMKEYAENLPNNMSINRLMLPGFPHVSLSDFYDSLTEQEKKYVNPTGKQHRFSTDPHRPYIDSINIDQIGLRSASQFFDTDDKTNGVVEIYPTIEEMEIGGVRVDEIDEGVAPDDDGRFGDNETVKNVDIYLKKAIDFDINDLKDDDFSISMKDGMCGGRTFKVASSAKIDGRWRLTIERVKDDALELWFPYKDYPIKKGDHFVLTGITLPDSYVNAASLKLLKYAIVLLDKNDYTRYVYQPKVDDIFMARQHDQAEADDTGVIKSLHDTLKAGDLMNFNDTDLNIEGIISIDQLTIKEEDGKIPTYGITLREDKEVGTIQKIQQQISSLQSGNGGTGAGLTTTQVKNQVATEGSKHFISKINDDIAKGTVTWEKVQKFLGGLLVGNFNSENGGSWTPDAEGRSHLITDYLEVRMKAIFEELVIKKTSTISGKEIISPAGGVVAHKVEEVTVTYNNVSQKAYRCYFLAEQDGDAVDNDFAVNDQVRSESFNVRKGTYHKVGNHFYWRLVIGRDEDPVELEGKKYHYIDLSDTDCATASDVPAKGDVLNQCGNRTDVERQNCLIFSAVDNYSPSISLYHGINSYSFANREYVEYGVNKQNNKAFFNVYGDMYVGDRPTKENGYEGSSYIKYDSAAKQVSIKGKLSAKSTVDGKELSQYIKENSAKGLTEEQVNNLIKNSQVIADLQNQVDGAIETWFYEGVPTLNNAPASSWATDKEKDTHLGDLYYDNKTGKAYRFAKDGNTYKWTIITDTDIAKALSDASKAQETADGKMKVFSTQPTPPYQVGDIWVNATYPTDGSTYKNEVLRCQTAKGAGSQFAIGDWIKASKYTDDTVANAAKAAAEKAQKAAEKAQGDISKLGTTVTTNKKAFDSYVTDGYLEPSEIAAMAQDSKRLEDDFAAAEKSYNEVKGAEVLKSTKELTDLNTAFTTLSTAKTELIKYLSDISKRYNASDTNGKATIVSAVGTKFTNFQSAYSAFYDKLGFANAYITSKIYGDLKQNITDLAGYKYLKDALGQTTDIDGGLVMTTLLALRDADGNVQSGINGAIDPNRGKKSIATWWGGQMVDKDYNSGNLTPATSLIRFDGSGYLASGAIWWDVSGKVHADPTSFIISEKNLGAYLTFFEPTWKAGSAGTSVADLVSLKPNAPFTKLGVSGDATFEGAISFHGIKLTYDATNKAIKIDGNLYATGGISAYGASDATSGGGGLNGSVKSYADALKLTSESLSEVASAYSIKALSRRIDNIATELGGLNLSWNNITGKPSTFTPSAHTHKWTEITDRITKVSQLTNDAGYLTAHQSLASYYTKAEIDAKGYTTNKGTVTSVALTLPTGLTCATKTITTSGTFAISLASGYSIPTTAKQTAWDGAVSAKHTHSNKSVLDGISSTKVSHWDSAYGWYALMTTDEETADGVINKWNEVVSFLANIAQTDTLSGIVDGINKSISDEVTRAKKAEGVNASGISTNKTSITTLQGYFTSGSAKKALQLTNARKLWGNSFNGTADINGSIIVPSGKYISIGNIKLEYDAANKALKITNTTTEEVANLYTSGGVSAYGVGASSSSGGGLNGSVKAYADAIRLTTENLSEIASAYSVAKLYLEIQNLASAVPSISVSVPTGGNALTGATYDASTGTITFTKGTFLTAHQSLDGYVNAISVSGSGNAITSVSKSGKGITFTKGATFLTSHQSLANYYTKSSVDSLLSGKSATSHTHSVKINGITKTIAASGGDAVDLGTYLTAHQSLAAYATQNWVKNEATAHNADMVDNYHASGLFTGFSISDVANKVTISIGGTSKALNLVRAFPSGVGNNFNDIATHGNSMGMSNIAAPYASSTANYQTLNGYVNPNGQTGWHHYINLSFTDSNNTATSPNMWQTQFAIKAGTTEVYVRSRAGGKISNDAAWAAPWVRLARVTDNVASASKVVNALSWSGYSSGSYNGSAVKSISIPNNTNQLTNGAGFITSSASITGNAGSATKLQNARTINGTSFNGTANIVTSYWGTTRKLWGNSVNGNADVNGSITIANTDGVYVQIGDVRLVYDKANTAIKVVKSDGTTAANFYATGGITAYGEGSAGTTGSNNFSAKAYADSIKLTSENLSEIASAYSIAVLNNSLNAAIGRISTLEGGSATSIETTGSGNAVTSVSKSGTKITFTKGSTFSLNGHTHTFASLTSKPTSLSGYGITDGVNAVSVTGSGNAITTASISGHTLTLTKGSSFSLSSHTHGLLHTDFVKVIDDTSTDNGWTMINDTYRGFILKSLRTQANAPSWVVNNYAAGIAFGGSDTKGVLSVAYLGASVGFKIAGGNGTKPVWWMQFHGTSGENYNMDNFSVKSHTHKWADITDRPSSLKNPSALSWSGYSSGSYDGSAAKSISIPNNTNQLTNGAGFITASASITGNAATATKVNHSLSVFGKSFNGSADVTVADTDLIASISTATANLTDKTEILTSWSSDNGFNDSNSKNRIYRRPASAIWGYINSKTISNADKLDNVHLNGIFTALSNTNNGVSMTIGTVAKSLANMQVYSATKLVTARNIALNGDFTGNANFDGSANITINGYMSYCNATVSNTNTYPWRRIAKVNEITGNYADGCILLYISEGFNGGCYGIARVYIKTDNLSTGANASCSIQWISRNGYGLDSLKIAMYKTTGKAYYDVFLKMRGAYGSVVIRTLQDQRGGLGKIFTLVNSTESTNAASHTEAYATIEDAATAIHNQAYTSIQQGSDVATVHNADMVDGIHASGLFTNLSNSGNSLSITVGGTNKKLTVNYASNAGNADTLDGVHASGLFTNLSNSGNNISITIGGTNKTLTAAYATNCDTVDGYHAQLGSSKPYGKIPVIGTDGVIELGHYIDFHHDNTTGSDYSVRLQTNGNHSNVVTLPTATGTLALTSGNVASATKLQTARTIWGQSFNGTANVSGALSGATTISASNTISTTLQNGALKIGNKSTPISAIDAQVIFNTGAAIRFGETAWDWNQWAGLKYTHSNKTVYLGIADGSVFNANKAQSYGKLQLKAIDRILFDSDSDNFQIYCDNSYDCLRIGSSDNSGYVLVSDIGNWDIDGGDEYGANNWRISIDGSSLFKKISCPSIYTADSITSTSNKALLLSGNVIREYHHGGSLYYSSITFKDTTLDLSAYGNIGLTSVQGITINGGNGTISMVATGGFDVTYRAASLSVSQTGPSEYTWTFNNGSIKTTGGITAYQSSDERLKHNIHGVDSLAIIKAMGGTVAFRYNEDDKASIGWIAQRVLHNTLMQDLVEKDEDGYLKINYWSPKLIAVAFGAIEQVDDEVAKLKARVRELENEVEQLKSDRL